MTTPQRTRKTTERTMDAMVGERAHMMLFRNRIKQGDAAAALGMSSDSLGRKLKGERGWALDEVAAVARYLGVSIAFLMGEDSPAPVGPKSPNGPLGD